MAKEYQVVHIAETLTLARGGADMPNTTDLMNDYSEAGWTVLQVTPSTQGQAVIITFERER